MGRADAPLRPADDAIILDTSTLSIAEAVERALTVIRGSLPART